MIGILIERVRYVRAWLAWVRSVRQTAPAGLEALFGAEEASATTYPVAIVMRCDRVGCPTCQPRDDREVTRAYWWLRESLAETWYAKPHEEVLEAAQRIVALRQRAAVRV